MKNFIKIFSLLFTLSLFVSCNTDEKFSGSPEGNLEIITLKGTVTTHVTSALTSQKVPFTVTLPENKTFADTVTVEVSSTAKSGGRTRTSVDIMPGQSSATGEITAVGGSIFKTTFDLSLTAINLKTVEPGKHYLMTSDKVTIDTGNSSIPDSDSSRLIVRLLWPFPSATNKLKFVLDRPGTIADATVLTLNSYGKVHFLLNNGTTNSANISTAEGDYIINITAEALTTSPVDLPYRLLLVHPDGKVEVFEGVYNALTTTSPLLPVLKINKTITNGVAVYTATDMF